MPRDHPDVETIGAGGGPRDDPEIPCHGCGATERFMTIKGSDEWTVEITDDETGAWVGICPDCSESERAEKGDEVRVYNRTAVVEKRLPDVSIVRWQDNGTQGFVPTDRLDGDAE